MIKKIGLIVFILALLVFGCVCVYAKDAEIKTFGDYQYIEENGNITIVGYIGENTKIEIPSQINGKNVTKIGESAFYEKTFVKIVLPNTIDTLESNAFGSCDVVTNLVISSELTNVASNAFLGTTVIKISNKSSVDLRPGTQDYGSVLYTCLYIEDENGNQYVNSMWVSEIFEYQDFVVGKYTYSKYDIIIAYLGDDEIAYLPESINGEPYIVSSRQMENVVFPESSENIKGIQFASNKTLKSVVLPKDLKVLKSHVVSFCSK